ncbi:MAG: dienelactone hydrolase family protein [Deltaproteobacteria bacterium]|nr:MAG: dienelactone hydrolase family protein [Deltaproteobacteria bacterium]TMB15519.1 MAG: dienelactone hydrolase family protein [Deltaproteobacteria bacterium]
MDVQTEMIEVPPSGGMTCFIARPTGAARAPGILVIQEAFGLNGHIQDVARRIAAEGYVALAPDLYWRAGQRRTVGYDQIGEAIALMQGVSDKDIVADVGSAIGYLERQPFVRSDRIGITGFCMGGRVSYLAACELPEKIKASAPFYGGGIPIDKTPKLRAPVLAFFGEKDAFIPLDSVEQLKAELARTGKQAEVIVYPGADHGFFCDERASYQAEAARDAWERLKRFFAAHLQG